MWLSDGQPAHITADKTRADIVAPGIKTTVLTGIGCNVYCCNKVSFICQCSSECAQTTADFEYPERLGKRLINDK